MFAVDIPVMYRDRGRKLSFYYIGKCKVQAAESKMPNSLGTKHQHANMLGSGICCVCSECGNNVVCIGSCLARHRHHGHRHNHHHSIHVTI